MSRLSAASLTTTALVSFVMIASAVAIAAVLPLAREATTAQAGTLQSQARQHPAEAIADLTLATWLEPSNQTIQFELAQAFAADGQSQLALAHISRADATIPTKTLRQRILLELNQPDEAADLIGENSPAANNVLDAATLALAGRSRNLNLITALETDRESAQAISRVKSGQMPFAEELYALGLRESAQRTAEKQPVSYEREILLGRISFDRGSEADLSTALGHLSTAVKENPSSVETRELLQRIYRLQKRNDLAAREAELVTTLRAE